MRQNRQKTISENMNQPAQQYRNYLLTLLSIIIFFQINVFHTHYRLVLLFLKQLFEYFERFCGISDWKIL